MYIASSPPHAIIGGDFRQDGEVDAARARVVEVAVDQRVARRPLPHARRRRDLRRRRRR